MYLAVLRRLEFLFDCFLLVIHVRLCQGMVLHAVTLSTCCRLTVLVVIILVSIRIALVKRLVVVELLVQCACHTS